MRHWVMTWLLDPLHVRFTGPFEDEDAAADWGREWQKREGDNPCWQTLPCPLGTTPLNHTVVDRIDA